MKQSSVARIRWQNVINASCPYRTQSSATSPEADQKTRIVGSGEIHEQSPYPWVYRNLSSLRSVIEWAERFLSCPHEELGRDGAVCPFIESSLNQGHFYLTVFNGAHPTTQGVKSRLTEVREFVLARVSAATAKEAVLVTVVMCFPDLAAADAPPVIDHLQAEMKKDFVKAGLMLGQFHRECDVQGLHNPQFRPLRSPVPLLAVRSIVPGDFLFLRHKTEYVDAYLSHISWERISKHLLPQVKDAAEEFGIVIP